MEGTIRVVLVDDSATLRYGLERVFELAPDIGIVGEAGDGQTARMQVAALSPDVVILDCHLPDEDGPQVAEAMRALDRPPHVLAFSAHADEEDVRGMLEAGAVGYLLKEEPPMRIIEAVRAAAGGKGWLSAQVAAHVADQHSDRLNRSSILTEREIQVLRMVAQGKTNAAIAAALNVAERTVCFHLGRTFDKLGVHSRTEAAVWAVAHPMPDNGRGDRPNI